MSNLTKGIILVVAVLAIGAGLVVWKNKVGGSGHAVALNSITKEEIELLLADAAKTNPMVLRRLKDDPEARKQQINTIKEILAFASQAKREGLADTPSNKQELESIRAEVVAVNYDKEVNKDKGPMPAFGFLTEEQIKAYWDEDQNPPAKGFMDKIGLGGHTESRTHDQEFNDFLNAKIEVLKAGNPAMKDREISDEERTQAREVFAKIRLYAREFDQKQKAGELSKEFVDRTNLQVKLQQASFLARLYSEKAQEQIKVTDEEIDKYIAEHPELSPESKKAKAQEVLDRAKAGEDFTALATEFSEDPGSKAEGGLYKDVPKGRMVAPFEQAALALEPGQVAPELVSTDFGFHIVKLERKLGPSANKDKKPATPPMGDESGETYDVRHILISTSIKDPENPMGRDQPVKEFVKAKLEQDKEKALIDKIVADNHVTVPEDFSVPEVSDEQMQQMRQQQMQQMQQTQPPPGAEVPGDEDAPPPAANKDAKKPDSKKK